MTKVVLFGNGSVASNAYFTLPQNSSYEVAGFTVDRQYIEEDTLFGLPLVPFDEVEENFPPDEYKMHIAVGYVRVNKLRAERYYQAKEMGYQLVSDVSATVTFRTQLVIGENCRIGTHTIIGPLAEIGNNVIIAPGCIIGHNTIIKDHCFLASGVVIPGGVTIEPYCFLGANTTIRNKVTIARECVIGAGSVILEDTEEKGVYLAQPADRLPISSDKLPLS